MSLRFFLAVALLAASSACRDGPTSTPTQTSTPTPTPTQTAAQTSTSNPQSAPVSRASVIEPGGTGPLGHDGETVVDPASSFEVELAGRLANARVVLLDGSDAHVPARATQEVGSSTRLTLTPAGPLVPGSRYLLRVEGATRREILDGAAAYTPVAYRLLAAGTPPPPEPRKKSKAKKRR